MNDIILYAYENPVAAWLGTGAMVGFLTAVYAYFTDDDIRNESQLVEMAFIGLILLGAILGPNGIFYSLWIVINDHLDKYKYNIRFTDNKGE